MNARRRGYSLVEMLVAMSLLGAALASVTFSLYVLLQSEHSLRGDLIRDRSLTRFTTQLRFDAHGAADATVVDQEASRDLTLVLPDQRTIHYRLGRDRIDREVRLADAVAHRETYRLPGTVTGRWSITEAGPPMITLMLELRQSRKPITQSHRILAARGIVVPL